MIAKNYLAGAAAALALVINSPTNAAPAEDDAEFTAPFQNAPVIVIEEPEPEPYRYEPPERTRERILPPSRINAPAYPAKLQERVKYQKARFVKLAADDMYTYYLDKSAVDWKRVPYFSGEYMADVWIRMVEHSVDTSELPSDLAEYINDTEIAERQIARENGRDLNPVDVEVLQHKKYFLEHYYLRPKTKQIQFLCELEVVGHPQNTVSERQYEYKNWENLIPGSIESIIFTTVLKEIGTKKATERGHMTFADAIEEYARISIR